MGKTKRRRRRRNRKKKTDASAAAAASSKDTIKNSINIGVNVPWSELNHDALLLVMMRLGIVDFFALSGVCKPWRSLAVSNKNKFIVSKPPMSIHVYRNRKAKAKKEEFHFKDFEERKFKPIIPHYAGDRRCIGVISGYLMLLTYNDLRLVNPMTKHELNFPQVPNRLSCYEVNVRAILVFSPSISGWVLVVLLNFCYCDIWFAVEGKQEWTRVSTSNFIMCDLHAFKGKIYVIHFEKEFESHNESDQLRLSEMRLYPEPEFVLLETESIPRTDFKSHGFVYSGENLYVIDRVSTHPYMNIHELDFGEMKLVSREKEGKEYAFFRYWDHGSVSLPVVIIDLRSQYGRYVVTDKNKRKNFCYAKMWYFFHDCLNDNLLHA